MISLNMTLIRREAPEDGEPGPEGQTPVGLSIGVGVIDGKIILGLAQGGASMSGHLDYKTAELVQLALERALCEALVADPTAQELDDLADDDLDSDDFDPPAQEA